MVALHSLLLESNRGHEMSLTGDGSGMDRNGALEPQTDYLYVCPEWEGLVVVIRPFRSLVF